MIPDPQTALPVKRWSEVLPVFEGRIDFMALDSSGVVFTGVGHSIFSREDAVVVFADPAAAEEWDTIKAMTPGRAAAYYAGFTDCRLTDADIDKLRDSDVDRFTAELAQRHPSSVTWPDGPRDSMLDIFYNTGEIFQHCAAAIDNQQWETAAIQSHRLETPDANGNPVPGGIQKARNDWARAAILSAVPSSVS
jgi:GH24 family phage-related lysozyme (muramidase)